MLKMKLSLLSSIFIATLLLTSCGVSNIEKSKKSATKQTKAHKIIKIVKPVEMKQEKVSVTNKTKIYLTFDKHDGKKFINEKNKKDSVEIINKITLHDSPFGKALRTHKDAYVKFKGMHTIAHVMMVEFWIMRGSKSQKTTLLKTLDNAGKYGWKVELASEENKNLLTWYVTHPDGTSTKLTSSRGLKDPSKWYKVSLTWGSIYGGQKALRIHIDGDIVAEIPSYKIMRTVTGALEIKSPKNGLIDDLAITADSQIIFRDIKDVNIPVTNLNFEQKSKGWVGVYNDLEIDSKEKHSGKYSLKIETDDLYTREFLSPIFSVTPDATYRISFWAKLDKFEKGYSAIGVWIRWYFAPEESSSIGGDIVANFTSDNKEKMFGWRKFTADVPVPRKSFYRKKIKWARLQIKNYHSQVLVWVDDIEVKKINQIKNK